MTFKSTPLHLKLRLSKSMMNVVATKMTRIFCCTVTYIDTFNLQNGTRNFPTLHGEGKKTLPDINSRLHKSDWCIYGKPPVLLLKAWFWPTWGNTYISPWISSLHVEQRSASLPNCPILHVDTSLLWWKLNLLPQSQTVFSGRGCTVHDQGLCMKRKIARSVVFFFLPTFVAMNSSTRARLPAQFYCNLLGFVANLTQSFLTTCLNLNFFLLNTSFPFPQTKFKVQMQFWHRGGDAACIHMKQEPGMVAKFKSENVLLSVSRVTLFLGLQNGIIHPAGHLCKVCLNYSMNS